MSDIHKVYWRHLRSRVGDLAFELTRVRSVSFQARDCWSPAVNAYWCRDAIVLCADLAGVREGDARVEVEPRRVVLSGFRRAPEPCESADPPRQILAMEIDHGRFERAILLPVDVDPEGVSTRREDGLLWVRLPVVVERSG